MLEDVGHSRGVTGHRAEDDAEGILRIGPADMQMLRARGGVVQFVADGIDFGQVLDAPHAVAVDLVAGLQAGVAGVRERIHARPLKYGWPAAAAADVAGDRDNGA